MRRANLMITTALLVTAALSACTQDKGQDPGTATIPVSTPTTSSPSPSASPTSDEAETTTEAPALSADERDKADVEATVLHYTEALSAAYEGEDIERIYPWSRDTAREQWVTQLMAEREQGLVIEGRTSIGVRKVDLNKDQADVLACVDYSQVTVTDKSGQDVTPDRESQRWLNLYVLKREESAEYGWIVVGDVDQDKPCAD